MCNATNKDEATELIQQAMQRLNEINAREASEKHGELMIPYAAVEVRLVAMKIPGELRQCDHLLHRVILRKCNEGIHSISGMRTVLLDADANPTFIPGRDPRSQTAITFDVLDWNGEVSASVDCRGYIEAAYIKLNHTTVYLPADME